MCAASGRSTANGPRRVSIRQFTQVENLPAAEQQQIENSLNFEAASIAAFIGYQQIRAAGSWPSGAAAGMAEQPQQPPQQPPHKMMLVASATSLGALSLAFGALRRNPRYGMLGSFFIAAGHATSLWMDIYRLPPQPPRPPRNDD